MDPGFRLAITQSIGLNDQSLWKVMGQFIMHLTHPIANMLITLKVCRG